MPSRIPPIARIRLARSWPRILALPLLLLLAGAGGAGAGIFLVGGPLGVGLAGVGALVGLAGLVVAGVLASIRIVVEESAVRLRRISGERVYPLTPGPVTRVRLRGDNASRLRARSRWMGWSLGRARLRDEEDIEIVRLARTPTVIILPTERGRLAIAPADERELLDVLARAARARQRLDEFAVPAAAPPVEAEVPTEALEPHILTGIERALLEERLAEERRAAAEAVAAAAAAEEAAAAAAATLEQQVQPTAVTEAPPASVQRRAVRAAWVGVPRVPLRRPRPSSVLVLIPLIGAGAAWAAGVFAGRMPETGTDLARLTSLALVLSGPATSVGAIMARAWWPRLVGVVVAGGLSASVFIGRALIGG